MAQETDMYKVDYMKAERRMSTCREILEPPEAGREAQSTFPLNLHFGLPGSRTVVCCFSVKLRQHMALCYSHCLLIQGKSKQEPATGHRQESATDEGQ